MNRCEDFFVQFQSDWEEANQYAPGFIRNKPDTSGFVTAKGLEDALKEYVKSGDFEDFAREVFRVVGNPEDYPNLAVTLLNDLVFRYGVNAVDSLAFLPVDRQSVVATLTGNNTLSLSGDLKAGQVMNIQVNPSVALKVTLPAGANFKLMDEEELNLEAGQTAEINVWCTGDGVYSVKTLVS
ncbi:MAG: hypothetical protein LBL07_05710 [Tannerella sp.]|nr:hypothetical protein [Tannerella sp.]